MYFKKITQSFIAICCLSIILFACNPSPSVHLETLDLMSYDMPIVIKAPVDAEVKKLDLIVQKDITVKKGDDFYLQIFQSDVETRNPADIKERLLKEVQANPFFDSLVKEEANGFIYKAQIDSVNANYGFRYARVQGDKEYTFQPGLIGTFTLDQVKVMFEAVK